MQQEFKNKNDYTCSAYMGSNKVNTMIYVHSVYAYTKYLEKNNIDYVKFFDVDVEYREEAVKQFKEELSKELLDKIKRLILLPTA